MNTETTQRWGAAERATTIRLLTRRDEILSYLEQDRLYAAYAIGHLEESGQCEAMVEESSSPALCLYFKRSNPPFLFAMGSERGVAAILGSGLCPWLVYLLYQPHQAAAIESFYRAGRKSVMRRMHITEKTFTPVNGEANRLTAWDADSLNELYTAEMDCYIHPRQIQQGVYYGVWRDGRLVSVAGTHVISRSQGIAAVGNVFTHPRHRHQGYATACTSAVTQELLRSCRDVVLNVREGNAPAIKVYERLGYREHCQLVEASGTWRLRTLLTQLTKRLL